MSGGSQTLSLCLSLSVTNGGVRGEGGGSQSLLIRRARSILLYKQENDLYYNFIGINIIKTHLKGQTYFYIFLTYPKYYSLQPSI